MISGARQARPSFFRRLVAWAQARELAAFVVPDPEAVHAVGVDLEAAGLQTADTLRHASVLVLVGELPPELKKAAAVAYAQMPRPRAILAIGAGDISPLPEPTASAEPRQEDVAAGVAELQRLFAQDAFSPEAADFDVDAVRTQTEYVCPMHPEVVRSEPGSCPICGMDLVPRESAGRDGHDGATDDGHGTQYEGMNHDAHVHHHGDHVSHGDMDHGEAEPHTAAHGEREEGRVERYEAMNHGDTDQGEMDQGGHGQEGAPRVEHDHEFHESTDHAGAHEVEAGAIPGSIGGSGHGGDGEHEGHDQHASTEHGEHEDQEHMDHGGHGHMDHGDMGFMSMVEMTKDLPRSSDGLQMEWVESVPFGPLFPGLPGGLTLTLTLDGDTVARAETKGIQGSQPTEESADPAEALADRLSRLDPLSPVAYRVLAWRALENMGRIQIDERTALTRIGALERERAVSHLGWLSVFGRLVGYPWLEGRASKLQISLVRAATTDEVARLRVEAGRVSRRVEITPLLRRKLRGVGLLPEGAQSWGPVARAGGVAEDSRADEEVYRSLGFEPVVREGDDALSRLMVRLAEIEQSLGLVGKAGEMALPEPAKSSEPSGEGSATIETPRGAAKLRITSGEGTISTVELDEPSVRHLGLAKDVAERQELADALAGVASLDLSPWRMAR